MAKAKLEQEREELRTLLGNGERIKFETTTKEKEFLEEQLQAVGAGDHQEVPVLGGGHDDQLYWPFQGEFWRDELGTYQYTLTKGCIERKTANSRARTSPTPRSRGEVDARRTAPPVPGRDG
jgi:hypothetical protein